MKIKTRPPNISTGGGSGRGGNKKLKCADPVRFRGRREFSASDDGDFGEDWKNKGVFQKGKKKKPTLRGEKLKPEVDVFDEKDCFRVIVILPYHNEEDYECKVKDGEFSIKSKVLASDLFSWELELPREVIIPSMKKIFNNQVLSITFEKKQQ